MNKDNCLIKIIETIQTIERVMKNKIFKVYFVLTLLILTMHGISTQIRIKDIPPKNDTDFFIGITILTIAILICTPCIAKQTKKLPDKKERKT